MTTKAHIANEFLFTIYNKHIFDSKIFVEDGKVYHSLSFTKGETTVNLTTAITSGGEPSDWAELTVTVTHVNAPDEIIITTEDVIEAIRAFETALDELLIPSLSE
jgi:hypothetical protein